MKQISIQLPDETIAQIAQLAEWWGEPAIRHNTPVITRCVERVFQNETTWRELEEFDKTASANNQGDA